MLEIQMFSIIDWWVCQSLLESLRCSRLHFLTFFYFMHNRHARTNFFVRNFDLWSEAHCPNVYAAYKAVQQRPAFQATTCVAHLPFFRPVLSSVDGMRLLILPTRCICLCSVSDEVLIQVYGEIKGRTSDARELEGLIAERTRELHAEKAKVGGGSGRQLP